MRISFKWIRGGGEGAGEVEGAGKAEGVVEGFKSQSTQITEGNLSKNILQVMLLQMFIHSLLYLMILLSFRTVELMERSRNWKRVGWLKFFKVFWIFFKIYYLTWDAY